MKHSSLYSCHKHNSCSHCAMKNENRGTVHAMLWWPDQSGCVLLAPLITLFDSKAVAKVPHHPKPYKALCRRVTAAFNARLHECLPSTDCWEEHCIVSTTLILNNCQWTCPKY